MSDLDLDKLKNIAEVAEEGWPDDPIRLVDPYSDPLEFEDKADEEYLKAFDPPTALALIRELEQALACCVHDGGSLVFESASLSGPNGEPLWSGDLAPSQRDIREQALHGFSAALERQGLEADALEMRDRMVRYYEEREYYRAWARTWKRLARNLFRELKIAMERQQADQKYIEQLEQNLNSLQVLCDYRAQTIKKTRNE